MSLSRIMRSSTLSLILFLLGIHEAEAQGPKPLAACKTFVNGTFQSFKELIHFPLIVVVVLYIINVLVGEDKGEGGGFGEKAKKIIPAGLMLYALANDFITTILSWIGC